MPIIKVGERELEVRDTLDGIMDFSAAVEKAKDIERKKGEELQSFAAMADLLAVVLSEWDLDGKKLNLGVTAAWLKANVRGLTGMPLLFGEVLEALGMRPVKPGEEQSLPTGTL